MLCALPFFVTRSLALPTFMVFNKNMVIAGVDTMVMVYWEMMAAAAICYAAIPFFDPHGFYLHGI